jgi:2-aminoadipate transaminase
MSAAAAIVEKAPFLRLARRMSRVKSSAVREILKVAERPDILSFAGGLPAPELFPLAAIAQAHAETFAEEGRAALQYSTTEGFAPLRSWIAERCRQQGARVTADQVLVTHGSQQGLDLIAKVLLDPGDVVVVENPSYVAALQAFDAYEAELVGVGGDADGLRIDELERVARERQPKLVYVVPNFQNPTGTTLALDRRHALVALAQRYGFLILEDDPYGELRFRGEMLPPLLALDDAAVVVSLSTFSKTLAPGLRVGWIAGPTDLVRSLAIAKQSTDLHTSTLAQRAIVRLLASFDYAAHVEDLRRAYGERGRAMLAALATSMPAGTRWTEPDGGMFVWVELPGDLSGEELFPRALEQKVAFVPGAPFFTSHPRKECIRLNYSNRPPELIAEGMRRLGAVIAEA